MLTTNVIDNIFIRYCNSVDNSPQTHPCSVGKKHSSTTPKPSYTFPHRCLGMLDDVKREPGESSPIPEHPTTSTAPSLNLSSVLGPALGLGSGKTQTVFIHKLYDMLHDPTILHLIWWLPTNDSFYLLPGEDFLKVLAQYFKHTNIASFIRQLNMYGFHKVNDTFQSDSNSLDKDLVATKWEFRHSTNQFRKGDIELLKLIKRRLLKNVNSHKEIVNLLLIPPTLAPLEYFPPMGPTPMVVHQMVPAPLGVLPQPPPQQGPPAPCYSLPPDILRRQSQEQQPHLTPHLPHRNLATTAMPGSPQLPSQAQGTNVVPTPASSVQSQPSQRPSLTQQNSFERSLNIRFIEVNNQVGVLRNELAVANQRNELLGIELRRVHLDTLKILDLMERYLNPMALSQGLSSTTSQANTASSNNQANTASVPDRLNNRTPVNKITPLQEPEESPMLKPKVGSTAAAFEQEVRGLRMTVLQRLETTQFGSSTPPPQSLNYHLNNMLRQPSLSLVNIVPQNYPLNPNYALYQKKLQPEPLTLRHRLVFMDPLQPIPLRKNSTILIDGDHGVNATTSTPSALTQPPPAVGQLRAELKLYLPLLLANVQQHGPSPRPQSPGSHERNPLASLVTLHTPLTRTNLLPVAVGSELLVFNPNPNYHYLQRNSFTSMYDQRRSTVGQTLVPHFQFNTSQNLGHSVSSTGQAVPSNPTTLPVAPGQQLPQPLQTSRPGLAVGKLPQINPIRLILPTNPGHQRIPSPLLTMLPRLVPADAQALSKEKTKNTLPLVLELDKLIKLAALRPFFNLVTPADPSPQLSPADDSDREFKKRKMNETPV